MINILSRLDTFGASPNKIAALGENVLLLCNLGGLAYLYGRFLFAGKSFASLEAFQVWCIPFYVVWMGCVAFVFPILFRFA